MYYLINIQFYNLTCIKNYACRYLVYDIGSSIAAIHGFIMLEVVVDQI